jgi:lipopolysaccharide/colanic/teichoic acid biosynthesis glycosyltransferase
VVDDYPFAERFTWWLLVYGAVFALAAFAIGVPALVERPRQAVVGSALAALLPFLGAAAFFVLYLPFVPRLVIAGSPVVVFVVLLVCSLLHAASVRRSHQSDRVIAVVSHSEAVALERDLLRAPERRFTMVAHVDLDALDVAGVDLPAEVTAHDANLVVLSEAAQDDASLVAQAAQLHEGGVRIRSLTMFYDEWLGKLPVNELARTSLWFDIRDIHEIHYSRVKRVMDVSIALAVLPVFVLSIPLVVVGNLIGNRGPLFFKQVRVGQRNQPFTMWKYRSMLPTTTAHGAGEWTATDDPRITSFGRLLRKSHLDELPQIVNVLRGELSIVGPRPEQQHYVELLTASIPFYSLRHAVKPGITGWAQVKYPYGASEDDALEKLQYELYYLRHQSLSLDLRVCGRTASSMLLGKGR